MREHRVGGQASAHEAVEARPVLRVLGANKSDVLDFVRHVLPGVARNSGLKLAWEVVELLAREVVILDLLDGRGGVDNFVSSHSRYR